MKSILFLVLILFVNESQAVLKSAPVSKFVVTKENPSDSNNQYAPVIATMHFETADAAGKFYAVTQSSSATVYGGPKLWGAYTLYVRDSHLYARFKVDIGTENDRFILIGAVTPLGIVTLAGNLKPIAVIDLGADPRPKFSLHISGLAETR